VTSPSGRLRGVMPVVGAIARRPRLWFPALRQARALVPEQWWRRRPFLPVPDAEFLAFRAVTQYGQHDHRLEAHDVVDYVAWCESMRRLRRVAR
jgi:hypothetical protein